MTTKPLDGFLIAITTPVIETDTAAGFAPTGSKQTLHLPTHLIKRSTNQASERVPVSSVSKRVALVTAVSALDHHTTRIYRDTTGSQAGFPLTATFSKDKRFDCQVTLQPIEKSSTCDLNPRPPAVPRPPTTGGRVPQSNLSASVESADCQQRYPTSCVPTVV